MNKNKIRIKDINNKEYLIYDLDRFIDHIEKFHSSGSSIHEENGFYFLIDDKFRSLIKEYIK